jgi:hypothetical protein
MKAAPLLQDMKMLPDFAFSNGWLKNFKSNNKIKVYVGNGGERSVDMVLNISKIGDIANSLSDYHLYNLYNCDEAGLYH